MRRVLPGLALLTALLWAVLSPASAQTVAATTNASVLITTGNTYQTVLAALTGFATRRSLTIQNNNTTTDNCWIFIGSGAATKPTSILLPPAWSYTRYFPYIPSDAIQATCATTGNSVYVDVQ